MLSIHYVLIMMRILYIDWQQHWECDRIMNIGANAQGEPINGNIIKWPGHESDHPMNMIFTPHGNTLNSCPW